MANIQASTFFRAEPSVSSVSRTRSDLSISITGGVFFSIPSSPAPTPTPASSTTESHSDTAVSPSPSPTVGTSPTTMSDTIPESTGGIETWKVVLCILLPLFCLSAAVAVFIFVRQRRNSKKRDSDVERIGTMMDELQTGQHNVETMTKTLQAGVDRVKAMETELKTREANLAQTYANLEGPNSQHYALAPPGPWTPCPIASPTTPTPTARSHAPAGPRPLSGSTLQGTLPHSAPGLQHLAQSHPHPGFNPTVSDGSRGLGDMYVQYKPPSTITEESSGELPSPFDSPMDSPNNSVVRHTDGSLRIDAREGQNLLHKKPGIKGLHSMPAASLSPLRSDPSHPDLVPSPLMVVKRNSVHESSTGTGSGTSEGLDKRILRRSVSNPPTTRGYAPETGAAATPADESHTTTPAADTSAGIMTPPPTAEPVLRGKADAPEGKRDSSSSSVSSSDISLSQPSGPKKASSKIPIANPPIRPLPQHPKRPSGGQTMPPPASPPPTIPLPPVPAAKPKRGSSIRTNASTRLFGSRSNSRSRKLTQSYASSQCLPHVGSVETMTTLSGDRASSIYSQDDKENVPKGGNGSLLRDMSATLRFVDGDDSELRES